MTLRPQSERALTASVAVRARSWRAGRAALGAFAALLVLAALAAPAQAGPPVHRFLDSFDGSNTPAGDFDKPCGTAVDSSGNVYVASAGNDAIDVFDPARNHLATITNINEPCGLAVDSNGDLYVTETDVMATGVSRVVRYSPDSFPLSASPSWGAPEPIDSSGAAKGIAVDPFDDFLYVARGDHIAAYNPGGTLGIDEVQRLFTRATGGSYTLSFQGQTTAPLGFDASPGEIEAALEALPAIGPGDVSVSRVSQNPPSTVSEVNFVGALGATDVEQLVADPSGLTLTSGSPSASVQTETQGYDGLIGDGGELSDATGVAAHSFGSGDRYVFAADAASDEIKAFTAARVPSGGIRNLALRHTINGSDTPDGSLGFGPAGAQLAVDRQNGHVLVYDDAHAVVDEFEATGRFVTQMDRAELADAGPTAIAVDRSGGPGDGTVYVSAGAGPGAELLAFAPFAPASRTPLPGLSRTVTNAAAVAVDSQGNFYVAADNLVRIFSPAGVPIGSIETGQRSNDLALDLAGNLYVFQNGTGAFGDERVLVYAPTVYPFGSQPSYGTPATATNLRGMKAIGVNPANGHLFVTTALTVVEYDSVANGSAIVDPDFGVSLGGQYTDVAVHGASGEVYVGNTNGDVGVYDAAGRVVRVIDGSSSPAGDLRSANSLAVDQSSGHLVVSTVSATGSVLEFEASGAFLAETGAFPPGAGSAGVAIDNSGGPTDGNLYHAYINDVQAFGPLSYGEVPVVVTGNASGLGGGQATLNGTVDPRGFVTTACRFEYTDEADFQANGFASASSTACAEDAGEIGSGSGPVAVHAEVGGLDPAGAYRFRLVAENEFGPGEGQAVLFGPPVIAPRRATGIHYSEAVLNAALNPSGLSTSWRFEYGTAGPCDANPCSSTVERTLAAGASAVEIKAPLLGLQEGTTYHYRLVAENAAATVTGPDQSFTTLAHRTQDCPNTAFRTGPSAGLPDCRAYELVTPADMHGLNPQATVSAFNNWLVTPRGETAGDSLVFFTSRTLPGTDGNGELDGFRARRGADGWQSELFGPTNAQAPGSGRLRANPEHHGVSSDLGYSFWDFVPPEVPPGGDRSHFLRTPAGFELVGHGSLGSDPVAVGNVLTREAGHVVFTSDAHLEPGAAPAGTRAVYDRSPGGATHVVSLLPDEVTPAAGQHASFEGISEDGSAVAFELGGSLYVRRGNAETVKVADAPVTFGGLSADGERIFYAAFAGASGGVAPADLFAFELDTRMATPIASDAVFVNVSDDGSRAYFRSKQQLDPPAGVVGADNLYLWDGSGLRFVAQLHPQDLQGDDHLGNWIVAVAPPGGRASEASRSTPDGLVLLFQSHGNLTGQNPDGFSQVYRFDSSDASLLCVSCSPAGEPAGGEAVLQRFESQQQPARASTLIPNVTDDGRTAFFESGERLLPEDNNGHIDVYEWQAEGTGGCTRPGGCLALISTGRAATDSLLYGMTADGSDVFVWTYERLVAGDLASSRSIYDARVGGGFAEEGAEPCVEDACQSPAGAPAAPAIGSVGFVGGGNDAVARKLRVLRKRFRRATLRVRVRVPAAGVLVAGGRGLKRTRRRVGEAGSYTLTVRLTRKARRALARRKRMRVAVRVRFTPRVGEASRARVSLIVRRPAKKGRRAQSGRVAGGERGGRR